MGFLCAFLFAVAAVAAVSAGPMPHYNCPEPPAPANGQFRSSPYYEGRAETEGYAPGHVIYYECDDGYELSGATWDACRYDGYLHVAEWLFPTPVCEGDGAEVTVGCGDLDDPEHGSVDYDSTTFGSTATYSCDEGYFRIGLETRICQTSGNWHGSAPVCNPVICGSLDNPDNGYVAFDSTTYLSEAMYSCNEGLVLVGDEVRVCQADGSWSGDVPVCEDEANNQW